MDMNLQFFAEAAVEGNDEVVQRYQEALYINIRPKSNAPVWALFGTGATKADESFDAQTSDKRYINQVSSSQNVTGYAYSVEYEYDQIPSQRAIKFIDSVAKKEKVGANAVTDLVIVSMNLAKSTDGYPSRKRRVAISPDSNADNDGTMTGSGSLLGRTDWTYGYFDVEKQVFTEDKTAEDAFDVPADTGQASAGGTAVDGSGEETKNVDNEDAGI